MAKKKIALDCGHGLKTAGKQTPTGIKEWELNDKVRDKVVANLSSYDVDFIFPDNNEGMTDESLSGRRSMYVNAGVDAFVSIHHNAYTGSWNNATGVEVYTDRGPTVKDKELATLIYNNMVKELGMKGRGIKEADWTVINQDKIPAVLTEGGFMDGIEDYKIITTDAGQTKYAKAISDALIVFLKLEKKEVAKPTTTTTAKDENKLQTLKQGSKGIDVTIFESIMKKLGYYTGEIDTSFGPKCEAACNAFQEKHPECGTDGEPDRIWGKKCWRKALALVTP